MSSTQHQLIEQCATRLRGIVEALDNIHDNTPHRWSTDLDDVHSSAESLLALIKDQAPARSEASFEEWLANELEGEDGQPVPAAVCDIALARRAFNHWPKLEQPAKVGGVRFSAGVSSRLVVEAAQRLYEFESTPEKEAERIERLQAFREQLDPLNLAPHAEAFNEAPDEALRPEQAEAERPEVVGYRIMRAQADKIYQRVDKAAAEYEAGRSALGYMEDIAEAALCLRNRLDDLLAAAPTQAQHSVPEISGIGRDAEHPRAVVLYLRNEPSEEDMRAIQNFLRAISADVLTQAQHSAGYAEARQCVNCRHIGINDAADYAACHDCRWTGPEPDEDKCPGCAGENCMAAACPECGGRYELVAEAKISTPAAQAGQVPEECAPGTYAIDYLDNWDGEGDRYFCIAEKTADGKWIRQESGQELLEYKGDAILAAWLLAASEAQERDK
ncbi:hypothetical protein OE494_06995 [Pseudomonas aeruginosa]|uniref:hypothetical protein n=1 Tax=Pseudomonas aeruginosa TaxID=287 RepID=UPI000448572B|nr:hypothetical protein [Pseudomonas aeruginosa]EJS3802670.1 hypothetical protein [Pseudomonas aeruginosa]EKA7889623.1 hypothetical protein [Pseudomonas aeruginosa]EKE3928405.1 hypothetical protein [Pseudomonas aeruginosa]EKJ6971058.1 hypothetical protein [Pseudomonas aeruginosa]EKU0811014.1 hypothetical protein [Pseudomonas aeruginosa]